MKTMAITSSKGGVGKSTLAANLAATFAMRGVRTLIVDLDPQGAVAHLLGMAHPDASTACEQLLGLKPPQLVAHPELDDLRAISADPMRDSLSASPPQGALAQLIARHEWQPQLVLLDLAPSLEPLTCWALNEADSALIVLKSSAMSVRTVPGLLRHILNRTQQTALEGMIVNLYGAESELGEQVTRAIEQTFAQWLLPISLPSDVALQRAALEGQPVFWTDAQSEAARALSKLAEHLAQRHPELMPAPVSARARVGQRG